MKPMPVALRFVALAAVSFGTVAFAPPTTPPGNALVILETKVQDLEKRLARLEALEGRCLDRTDGYVNPGAEPLEPMPNGAFLPAGWKVERGGDLQLLGKITAPNGEGMVVAKVNSPTDGWCRVLFLRAVDAVLSQD